MERLQFPANDFNQSYPTWNHPSIPSVDTDPSNLNLSAAAIDAFFNSSNCEDPIDQNDLFESPLSSIVSSPTTTSYTAGDSVQRLGSICNYLSTNTTPLCSPPKPNPREVRPPIPEIQLPNHQHPDLAPVNADPELPKYSVFGCRSFSGFNGQVGIGEPILSSSGSIDSPGVQMGGPDSKSDGGGFHHIVIGISRSSSPGNEQLGDCREGSSVDEQNQGGKLQTGPHYSRKRKSSHRGRGKEIPYPAPTKLGKDLASHGTNAKRSRAHEDDVKKENRSMKRNGGRNGNANAALVGNRRTKIEMEKPQEPPKDYIHVRARRGQATDSHSLAERVRRDKISERMKFLQELVPGCSEVTGKAVMLDEIINYVQSLQTQVEFLSWKLAAMHPWMDFNTDILLRKDIFQSLGALTQPMYTLDDSVQALQYTFRDQQMLQHCTSNGSVYPLNTVLLGTHDSPLPSADKLNSQFSACWEKNLQNIAQTDTPPNQSQTIQGLLKEEICRLLYGG